MGSIGEKLLGVSLSLAMAVALVPAAAFGEGDAAVGGSAKSAPAQSDLDSQVQLEEITGAQAESLVKIVGYEDEFRIVGQSATVNLSAISSEGSISANCFLYVKTKDGTAPYDVAWKRSVQTAGGEGVRMDVGNIESDKTLDPVDGTTEFRHYLANDTFDDESAFAYNYYVTIVDGDGNTCELAAPIKVINDSAGPGYTGVSPNFTKMPWSVEGDNGKEGDEWNGVRGLIYESALLSFDAMDKAEADTKFGGMLSEREKLCPLGGGSGSGSGGEGDSASPAAWTVALTEIPAGCDAYVDDILVALDAKAALGYTDAEWESLGMADAFTRDFHLLTDLPESVDITKGPELNPDGTVTLVIRSTASPTTGLIGSFALAQTTPEPRFRITTEARPAEGGTVTATSGADDNGYLYGDTPQFSIEAKDGYEIVGIDVYAADDGTGASGWASTPSYSTNQGAGGTTLTFTFPSDWGGGAQATSVPDALLVAKFRIKQTPPVSSYDVTVTAGEGGTVRVTGIAPTASGGASSIPIDKTIGAGRTETITFAANTDVTYAFNAAGGKELKTVWVTRDARPTTTPSEANGWWHPDFSGNTFTEHALASDWSVFAEFKDGINPPDETFAVGIDVVTGASTGSVTFANGATGKDVERGSDVSFIVTPANDHKLTKAEVWTCGSDGKYVFSEDIVGRLSGSTLVLRNVQADTEVRFSFTKSLSPGGNQGDVDTPPIAVVELGMKDVTGHTLSGSTNYPGGVAELLAGQPAELAFFYSPNPNAASPEWWVIDHLEITYADGTMVSNMQCAGKNVAQITSEQDATVVAVMRPADGGEGESGGTSPSDYEEENPSTPVVPVVPGGDVTVDPGTGDISIVPIDPSTGEPDPDKPTVVIKPDPANPGHYLSPVDDEGNKLTGDDAINSETGLPYVDKEGNLIGDGGAYDEKTGVWEPGWRLVPPRLVASETPQKQAIVPTDTDGEHFYYFSIDEVLLDGAVLVSGGVMGGSAGAGGSGDGSGSGSGAGGGSGDGSGAGAGVAAVGYDAAGIKRFDFDPATGKGEFVRLVDGTGGTTGVPAQYERTGETFSYDPETGVITFDRIDDPTAHMVQVKASRTVDIYLHSNDDDNGFVGTNSVMWAIDEDGKINALLVPPDGKELDRFTVNDEPRFDRDGGIDMMRTPTWDEYTDIGGANWANGKAARVADGGLVTMLADLFGAQEAHADDASGQVPEGAKAYTFTDEDKRACENVNRMLDDHTIDAYAEWTNTQLVPEPESMKYTITASVVAGKGTVDGAQVAVAEVNEGDSYTFTFAPEPGYQVARVNDNGTVTAWTVRSYTVTNVQSDRILEVSFGLMSTPGDNSMGAQTIRRISSMLNTGDVALPLMLVSLGVALGAIGVAVLVANRRRED